MPQNCPCPKQDPLAQTVYPPQGGKVYQANFFSEKISYAPLPPEKYAESIGEIRF